jgi:TPR repeat protein
MRLIRKMQVGLLALAAFPLVSCSNEDSTPASSDASSPEVKWGPAATPDGVLTPEKLLLQSRDALSGDPKAAYGLFIHFQKVGRPSEADKWARVGAENGDHNSMMYLAYQYEKAGGVEGCIRAVYWLSRARKVLESSADLSGSSEVLKSSVLMYMSDVDADIARLRRNTPGCQ